MTEQPIEQPVDALEELQTERSERLARQREAEQQVREALGRRRWWGLRLRHARKLQLLAENANEEASAPE